MPNRNSGKGEHPVYVAKRTATGVKHVKRRLHRVNLESSNYLSQIKYAKMRHKEPSVRRAGIPNQKKGFAANNESWGGGVRREQGE